MPENYDPAKMPGYPDYHPPYRHGDMSINGPGGTTTNLENDEKGLLETRLFEVIDGTTQAALGDDHPTYKQGIYTTN